MIKLESIILLMDALLMGAVISAFFRFMVLRTRDYLKEKGQVLRLYYMLVFASVLSVLPIAAWLVYSIALWCRSISGMHAVAGWFAVHIGMYVPGLFIAVWISGVIYEIFCLVKMQRRFQYMISASNRVITDGKILNMLEDFSVQANLSGTPLLFGNASVKSPFVKGVLNPVIVLPDRELSEKELQVIMAHEVEHCSRHDLFVRWSVKVSQMLLWFVPGNRFWMEELVELQESLCDQSVCSKYKDVIGTALIYYETILIISSVEDQMNPFFCSGIAERKSQARRRVENIYALQNAERKERLCASLVIMMIAAAGVMLNPIISLAYSQYASNKTDVYQIESDGFAPDADEEVCKVDFAGKIEELDVWNKFTEITLSPGASAFSRVYAKEADWVFQGVAVADGSDYEILIVGEDDVIRFTPNKDVCSFDEKIEAGVYYLEIVNHSKKSMNLELFVH